MWWEDLILISTSAALSLVVSYVSEKTGFTAYLKRTVQSAAQEAILHDKEVWGSRSSRREEPLPEIHLSEETARANHALIEYAYGVDPQAKVPVEEAVVDVTKPPPTEWDRLREGN
jgi:DNA-directed RNA polymerase specialized sigma subunit